MFRRLRARRWGRMETARHERPPIDEGPAPGSEPAYELAEVLGRYRLGDAGCDTLVPALAEELVGAQRVGEPLAATIVQVYAEALHAVVETALGTTGQDRPAGHTLLAPEGRIVSEDDPTRPAVSLAPEGHLWLPFNQFALDDAPGIHPHIHLAAAAYALGGVRSVEEVPAGPAVMLGWAWFLLAFSLNVHVRHEKMLGSDRGLIIGLVECCARLHELSDNSEPPAFVRDAIDRELLLRRFVREWVTSGRYATPDGDVIDEGRHTCWDAEFPLPVGALLRERFGGSRPVPAGPTAAIALGREKAALGDFAAAQAAFEFALADPEHASRAQGLLHDLAAEKACRELVVILVEDVLEAGGPARRRVVEIGRELHAIGGIAFMRDVWYELNERRRFESRTLSMLWNGVGEWQH